MRKISIGKFLVISRLNLSAEAISSEISGLPPSNAVEMENHAYSKAKNEDEYVALIRRLIVHISERINRSNAKPE